MYISFASVYINVLISRSLLTRVHNNSIHKYTTFYSNTNTFLQKSYVILSLILFEEPAWGDLMSKMFYNIIHFKVMVVDSEGWIQIFCSV